MLIRAFQKDAILLDDIKSSQATKDQLNLWWLGQSGYLIQWNEKHLLLDPYLSDSLTLKYADTDKQHIRMSELVIDPSKLDFIDIVTSSHNHTDHLDADTLVPLINNNPPIKMIIPEANRRFVCDRIGTKQDFPIGLNDTQIVTLDGFTFTGIPAAHNSLDRDDKGNCKFMGYVIQFGDWTIYHSGDTLWHDEVVDQLKPFKIDLALLPINGNKPERRVAGNLNAEEAVRLGKILGIKTIIPCHYDMFTFNTVTTDEFEAIAKAEGQDYKILTGGEKWVG